jgi:hypothetical protein
MTVANPADFASACQEAMVAVLGAIAAVGKDAEGFSLPPKGRPPEHRMTPIAMPSGASPTSCAGESKMSRLACWTPPSVETRSATAGCRGSDESADAHRSIFRQRQPTHRE